MLTTAELHMQGVTTLNFSVDTMLLKVNFEYFRDMEATLCQLGNDFQTFNAIQIFNQEVRLNRNVSNTVYAHSLFHLPTVSVCSDFMGYIGLVFTIQYIGKL